MQEEPEVPPGRLGLEEEYGPRLEQIKDGKWYVINEYDSARGAGIGGGHFRKVWPKEAHEWEFMGVRDKNGGDSSKLYARYIGTPADVA